MTPTFNKSDNLDASMYFDNQDNLKLFAKAYFHQAFEDGLTWSIAHNNWSNYRLLLGGSYGSALVTRKIFLEDSPQKNRTVWSRQN